jgi:hypothetical protein
MEIEGYKYIQHKLKSRPWGPECQFTVEKLIGGFIDDVISIPDMKIEESELAKLITERLKLIDHEIEPFIDPQMKMIEDAVAAKETEIRFILEQKGLLEKEQSIEDIKSKAEIVAAEAKIGDK